MPAIKLIEPPQLLVDWNRLGGEDRKCDEGICASYYYRHIDK
jgi:hypothetical protein